MFQLNKFDFFYISNLFDFQLFQFSFATQKPNRIWWIIAFGLSVCFCGLSIWHVSLRWKENPVTMCFTEKPGPISKIPFPTVTICPETKAHVNKFDVTNAFNFINGQRNDKFRPDEHPDKPDKPERPDRPVKPGPHLNLPNI